MSSISGPKLTRRTFLAWAGSIGVGVGLTEQAHALEPEVPIRLQVDLLNRVIPYDRSFASRVHGDLAVVVVTDSTHVDSTRIGVQLMNELQSRATLGGFRQRPVRLHFSDTATLIADCKRNKAGVVYITPGVRAPIASLATALHGLNVLSIAALPEQVRQGLVLGFAVRSGKPRLLVNLTQARQQKIDFRADFLRMAEVVG